MRPSFRRALTLTASLTATAVPAASAQAATPPADFRPFGPDSPWNQPLRANAPLHPSSAAWVSFLNAQVAAKGGYINTSTCGMPMFWADAGTARQRVVLASSSYQDKALISAWSSVPVPADAKAADCPDANFAVLQRQSDGTVDLWEFWTATKAADGTWTARFGGATQDVAADRGIASSLAWQDPLAVDPLARASSFGWNVTATSVSMAAGVITDEDLARGRIDHALALAPTQAAKGRWQWPAQRTDGGSLEADAIPEGAHLRLAPGLDLSTLTMTPLVRMMAVAAQRYGIIVRDRTGAANAFYAEPPAPGQPDPVRPYLDGQWPDAALRAFPWDKLEVLDAPSCSAWAECKATPQAVIDVDTPAPRVAEPLTLDTANSVLNHGRTSVRWDLDGDGAYETDAGRATRQTFTPTTSGQRRIGVRITTKDGVTVDGARDVAVAPAPLAAQVGAVDVTGTYFYPWSSKDTKLTAVQGPTVPPALPDANRRLYSTSLAGTATIRLGDPGAAVAPGGEIKAYVTCSAYRCLRLKALDASGSVVGQAAPAFGASGWVTIALTGGLTAEQASNLRLTLTVGGDRAQTGMTSISAVRAVLPGL